MINKNLKKYSKFLSLVLRHAPEEAGLTLDAQGWTDVPFLVKQLKNKFSDFSLALLYEIVAENDKKRFEFNATGLKIRASQGHSVVVDLGYETKQPPQTLYHGTQSENVGSIFDSGINKGSRHAVHLSEDIATATKVGSRRGTPVILVIDANAMHNDGLSFSQSTNGVWLTNEVPRRYIISTIYP